MAEITRFVQTNIIIDFRLVNARKTTTRMQLNRSENADYHYNKKRLREIDRRLRFLNKRLQSVYVVELPKTNLDKVYFGAWVTVEDEEGETRRYRIVGTDEIYDAPKGYISFKSPVARALIGKQLDDEVAVRTPGGEDVLCIVGIEYE
jgi:transcription elongation factor GreB